MLSQWIWNGEREVRLEWHLNEEPMEGNDVDDHSTPLNKLPRAYEYAQLLSKFAVDNSPFAIAGVMNMQSLIN